MSYAQKKYKLVINFQNKKTFSISLIHKLWLFTRKELTRLTKFSCSFYFLNAKFHPLKSFLATVKKERFKIKKCDLIPCFAHDSRRKLFLLKIALSYFSKSNHLKQDWFKTGFKTAIRTGLNPGYCF